MRAYRVEILPPNGRIAFDGAPAFYDESTPGQIAAQCGRGADHDAPDPACTCGIYACDRPSSLVTMLKCAEGSLATAARLARSQRLDARWLQARVVFLTGTLHDALPVQDSRHHAARPLYNDDLTFSQALTHAALGGAREVLCYTVTGDPPGTWRGASFATEHAVIMTFPGDQRKDYLDLPPCKTKLVTASAPDELLSARMKWHTESGSSDHRWWLA